MVVSVYYLTVSLHDYELILLSVPSVLEQNLPGVLLAFCVLLDRATHHFPLYHLQVTEH